MTHPARWSPEVLDVIAPLLLAEYPEWLGRPLVHDPFAGSGERLVEFSINVGFPVQGTEIEACYIETLATVRVGDSRDPATYPPAAGWRFDWLVMTSPVYPNGMADNHRARDTSRRRNYRKAKAEATGDPAAELDPANMANYGYRGTKRLEGGGRSIRRVKYWELADACVACWDSARMVIVNVSDFMYDNGKVEPVVDDWKQLLFRHGWTDQVDHPVGTPRMRDGENADQRVDHEVVIVARREGS